MEKSKFDNIWYTLTNRAGVYIEPSGLSPEAMKGVLSYLPPYAIENFVDNCQEVNTILSELMEKFRKYEQDRVCVDHIW